MHGKQSANGLEKDVIVNHSRVALSLQFFSRVNETRLQSAFNGKIDDVNRPRTFPFFLFLSTVPLNAK